MVDINKLVRENLLSLSPIHVPGMNSRVNQAFLWMPMKTLSEI